MRWWWLLAVLLVPALVGAGKGKKHKHQKPGRAVLDRLASTTLSEPANPADSASSGLLPPPLDAAPYSEIEASATCGENGVEDYCREMPGKRGIVCGACEGSGGAAARQHPPERALDGDPATWWQSPTFASGEQYKHVDLILTLPATMELLHVIVKSGPSPRPLAWSLEVSSSEGGDDWRLLRAFGDKEHCRKLWSLRPERRRRKVRAERGAKRSNADKPTCSTQFASPRPLENGEMHVGLGSGAVSRRVRISFLNAHRADPDRQYYTVRAVTLAARCLCHGHATECALRREGATCSCLHGTCGAHCTRCCDGGQWAPAEPCLGVGVGVGAGDCACARRGECLYDDTGAILCVNCTENRAGPLCDRCLPSYYSATSDGPCEPCDCHPEGSDGTCTYNRQQRQVSCSCRGGASGARCDACDDSAAVFPACDVTAVSTERCRCDPRGVADPDTVCDHQCRCKANVVGSRCDTCAVGYFGLSAALPGGCRPCYCSGVAADCQPDLSAGQDVSLSTAQWLVADVALNQTLAPSVDDQGRPYLISYEVEGWDTFYWSTTDFSGERWSSYGGEIRARQTWAVVRGDTGGNPTSGPDAVIIAKDGTVLTSAAVVHETPGLTELVVPLTEEHWFISDPVAGTEQVTRFQLMEVLKDVKALLVRAHFHLDQDEVRLEGAEVSGSPAQARETCACAAGYTGAQCGACAHTHVPVTRASSPHGRAPSLDCVPCPCHGHAGCETVDGPCGPCEHNTTGPHCERCLPGHYGNPVQGGCLPCACPLFLPSNNFSPLCAPATSGAGAGTGAGTGAADYVCTQCPDGHAGDHCELCDFGYWGSPTTPGSRCQRCECGGSPCDQETGSCLACTPDKRCDQCEEGYYLSNATSATGASCVKCACGAGAVAHDCDATGRCVCRAGWAEPLCVTCDTTHYDVSADCLPCQCGLASRGQSCDAAAGDCDCAPGAAPPRCATCLPDHYGLSTDGCAEQKNETRNNSNLDQDPEDKSDLSEDFSGTESNYTPPPNYVTSSEDEYSMFCHDSSKSADPVEEEYSSSAILDKRIQDTSITYILQNNAESDLSYVSNSPCREVISVPKNLIKPGPKNVIYTIPSVPEIDTVLSVPENEIDTVLSVPENEIDTVPSVPENEICTVPSVHDVTMDSYFEEDLNTTQTQEENLKPKKVIHKVIRGRDFCFYCENLVLNFARHLLRQHMYEPEVQRIISYPKNSIERKNKITELRKKGNYIQNSVNVTKPMRKQKHTDYLPCTDCLGFYSKKLLWKHKKKCSGKSNKNVQSEAQNLLLRHLKVDEKLKTTVFPRMRADKISLVAKSDVLICEYASQYLKTHREKHFVNVVSRKMREMAKLLIELKKIKPTINDFFDALKPEHYDDFVAATKIVGKFDSEKDRFDSPTFAMNIATSIKQCCNLAIIMALKKKGPYTEVQTGEVEAGLKTLIQLIDSNWKFDVSSQAATDLNKKKWNKITIIPLANDLKILKAYLQKKSDQAAKKIIEGSYTVATYIELLETVYCRVLLLNRRRPGELQRLYLHDYLENDTMQNNEKYEEFDRALTASERILVKKFKRVVIRGKRGRGVPVLFTEEVQKDIKTLLTVRNKFVSTSNKLLFANPGFENSIYGYKVLERLAKQSGAKNPKAISSTRLRKHLATLSQVFSMSQNDMEQLATFMGHTNEVHKKSYRLPDDVYQTAKISKLLLLMEDGKADLYKGKNLNDIELDLNEELEGETVENEDVLDYDLPDPSVSRQSPHDEPQPGSSRIEDQTDSQVPSAEPLNIKKGKKRTLVPWTDAQKKLVTTFFKRHIKNKQPPKRKECEELKDQNPEVLMNKDWLKIKVFVQNTYSKK